MPKIKLALLAWLLIPTLILTGAGCGSEEVEEVEETEPLEESLLEEAGVEEMTQYEAWVPGYWTLTIVAEEGEIDANLAFFDDGTAQGLYGFVRTEGLGQHVNYGPNSTGTWGLDEATIYLFGGTATNISGTVISETSMTGSITDQSGATYPWIAVKTGELDRVLDIVGTWMITFEMDGVIRHEQLECRASHVCFVTWEKYQGEYEGVPTEDRWYVADFQGGYDLSLEYSTPGSTLTHDLGASWNDEWGGWEVDGAYTDTGTGSSGQVLGIKMSE